MNTTYDFNNFLTLLEKAGIPVAVAAIIFKTSRPTIYSWGAGHPPNQELLLTTALRLIAMIERAVEAGDLPLPLYDKAEMAKGYDVIMYAAKVRGVLQRHLK